MGRSACLVLAARCWRSSPGAAALRDGLAVLSDARTRTGAKCKYLHAHGMGATSQARWPLGLAGRLLPAKCWSRATHYRAIDAT
ncbi:hypothetical protein NL676_038945 [Syzygium grande]|nr:hypothetical protein NL676_038945 [Syzygium grande]